MDEVKRILERWPARMPAAAAMRLLGVGKKAFFRRVREGCVPYAHDGPGTRKMYLTRAVCDMAGIDFNG